MHCNINKKEQDIVYMNKCEWLANYWGFSVLLTSFIKSKPNRILQFKITNKK
jgi:hypothetical protein